MCWPMLGLPFHWLMCPCCLVSSALVLHVHVDECMSVPMCLLSFYPISINIQFISALVCILYVINLAVCAPRKHASHDCVSFCVCVCVDPLTSAASWVNVRDCVNPGSRERGAWVIWWDVKGHAQSPHPYGVYHTHTFTHARMHTPTHSKQELSN